MALYQILLVPTTRLPLDISRNAGLGSLSCGDNLLTSLDVSNNTSLETL